MSIIELENFRKKIISKKPNNFGRIIALDVGTKRIGVAICDDQRIIPTPKTIISRQSNLKDFAKILQILQETNAIAIVIGLPLNQDNSNNAMVDFVWRFAKNFEQFLHNNFENSTIKNDIDILLFDERYSSFYARCLNRQKSSNQDLSRHLDDVSASLILEHFLHDFNQS